MLPSTPGLVLLSIVFVRWVTSYLIHEFRFNSNVKMMADASLLPPIVNKNNLQVLLRRRPLG